jgi:hypothetical protein
MCPFGACDVYGVTPLHLAAWKHDPAMLAGFSTAVHRVTRATMLLDARASLNASATSGGMWVCEIVGAREPALYDSCRSRMSLSWWVTRVLTAAACTVDLMCCRNWAAFHL